MKKLGIFGGTFNPIHNGHLRMADAAQKEYKLSYVYFMPCGIPPHKRKEKLLPAKLRCELILKAIKRKKYFKLLDTEIKHSSVPNYTIETIKELKKKKFTKNKELYFLIGSDEFEKLATWQKANELARLVIFLVLPRLPIKLKVPEIKNLKWHLVHTKPINISSTEIRKKVRLQSYPSH